MDPNQAYSAAEVERMMKLQDVLLKAMAGKMRWWEAAEIIGVSDRTMRRWRERLEKHGYDGLTGSVAKLKIRASAGAADRPQLRSKRNPKQLRYEAHLTNNILLR